MPLIKNKVGDKFLVWSQKKGAPSSRKAIISAHGDVVKINGMEQDGVPNDCQLIYYGPHGRQLKNPTLPPLIAGTGLQLESCKPKASQDYVLSKFSKTDETSTNHGSNGETYAFIQGMPEAFPDTAKFLLKMKMPAYAKGYETFEMDVITIRARRFYSDPHLSEVLKTLWKKNYKYDEIHCCFCRGSGELYNVTMKPEG